MNLNYGNISGVKVMIRLDFCAKVTIRYDWIFVVSNKGGAAATPPECIGRQGVVEPQAAPAPYLWPGPGTQIQYISPPYFLSLIHI
mgnify:FL=1